jgi:hypothetical protein
MTMQEILGVLLFVAGGWLFWSNLKAREAANAAIRAACRAQGLLFLDDTVGLESVRPVRDADGRMRIRWVYAFEYSDTGHDRRKGRVCLTGDTLSAVEIDPRPAPEGVLPH